MFRFDAINADHSYDRNRRQPVHSTRLPRQNDRCGHIFYGLSEMPHLFEAHRQRFHVAAPDISVPQVSIGALGDNPSATSVGTSDEASDSQMQFDPSTRTRQIGNHPRIATMNTMGGRTAFGAPAALGTDHMRRRRSRRVCDALPSRSIRQGSDRKAENGLAWR